MSPEPSIPTDAIRKTIQSIKIEKIQQIFISTDSEALSQTRIRVAEAVDIAYYPEIWNVADQHII
jgi:hypothetical protein